MEIYDVVTSLNGFSFIETEMCCSGNLNKPIWRRGGSYQPHMIYFVYQNKEGYELTKTIYDAIREDINERNSKIKLNAEFNIILVGEMKDLEDTAKKLKSCNPKKYSYYGSSERNGDTEVGFYVTYDGLDPIEGFIKDAKPPEGVNFEIYKGTIIGYAHWEDLNLPSDDFFWDAFRRGIKKYAGSIDNIL
ncbi:hypothetical protein KY347_07215 [Candidatus Woesearchaeota archaeon]|nr:hypothetical protein [Candidatus Woesearchaeota archaeon]